MAFHCRCGEEENNCAYPDCHNGEYDKKETEKNNLIIPKKYAVRLKTNALDFDGIVEDMCNEINYLEYKIDSLMFEYCSEEMTQEQIANFESHQRAASVPKGLENDNS